jgi:thiol-disulfide isomerase/thioredoxin
MRRSLAVFALLLIPIGAAAQERITGRLSREPVIDTAMELPLPLKPVEVEALPPLPSPPVPGDHLFRGRLHWQKSKAPGSEFILVMVEPASGAPYLYADVDRDGKIAAAERFAFADLPTGKEAAMLRVPFASGAIPYLPIQVRRVTEVEGEAPPPGFRFLMSTWYAFLEGEARVDGRPLKVRCAVDASTGKIDPKAGPVAMDLDGDGHFKTAFPSLEWDSSGIPPYVFRVGKRYLSIDESSDPASGRLVLLTHPASDYVRFDLRPGKRLPDFPFADMTGKQRRLSELRGHYVVLDFWATWCIGCVAGFDGIEKAWKTYHDRGLEIVAMDQDDELPALKAFLAKRPLPWIQATPESVNTLAHRSFCAGLPTMVLLDRGGR